MPVSWRIHRERVLILGWGRAIMLQLAHPLVAAGVAEHSRFDRRPGGRRQRANSTIHAFLALSFGTQVEAHTSANTINAIHKRVHGDLRQGASHIPAGTHYSAADPVLETWVHATLIDSFLLTYQRFVGPLSADEQDSYCAEARAIAPYLGIPVQMLPGSVRELRQYMDGMTASGVIEITDTARQVAGALLAPGIGPFERTAVPPMRLTTVGLLPEDIRRAYGFGDDWRRDRALDLMATSIRLSLPFMPRVARYWPEARRAESEGRLATSVAPGMAPNSSQIRP